LARTNDPTASVPDWKGLRHQKKNDFVARVPDIATCAYDTVAESFAKKPAAAAKNRNDRKLHRADTVL
jgi:hypothetical protein